VQTDFQEQDQHPTLLSCLRRNDWIRVQTLPPMGPRVGVVSTHYIFGSVPDRLPPSWKANIAQHITPDSWTSVLVSGRHYTVNRRITTQTYL
jgi:hypothetical protein